MMGPWLLALVTGARNVDTMNLMPTPQTAVEVHPRTDEQAGALGDGSLSLAGWASQMTREGLDEFHRRAAERRRRVTSA